MNLQSLADRQEEQSIHAYDVYRGWQDQYELAEIEARLRKEAAGRMGMQLRPLFAALLVGSGLVLCGALCAWLLVR